MRIRHDNRVTMSDRLNPRRNGDSIATENRAFRMLILPDRTAYSIRRNLLGLQLRFTSHCLPGRFTLAFEGCVTCGRTVAKAGSYQRLPDCIEHVEPVDR